MPAERQDLIRFMYVVIRIGSVGSWKNAQEKEGSGKKLCVGYGREKGKRKSSMSGLWGRKKKAVVVWVDYERKKGLCSWFPKSRYSDKF